MDLVKQKTFWGCVSKKERTVKKGKRHPNYETGTRLVLACSCWHLPAVGVITSL